MEKLKGERSKEKLRAKGEKSARVKYQRTVTLSATKGLFREVLHSAQNDKSKQSHCPVDKCHDLRLAGRRASKPKAVRLVLYSNE